MEILYWLLRNSMPNCKLDHRKAMKNLKANLFHILPINQNIYCDKISLKIDILFLILKLKLGTKHQVFNFIS